MPGATAASIVSKAGERDVELARTTKYRSESVALGHSRLGVAVRSAARAPRRTRKTARFNEAALTN